MTLLQLFARQRWIRRGVRERVLRAIAGPSKQPDTPFEAPFFGMRYQGRRSSYIDWNVWFYGSYETEILELIRAVLADRPGSVFFDVGANVGHHTLFASRHAQMVHAFEPFEPVRRALLEKLAANGLTNVAVHAFGLGDTTVSLPYAAPVGANQGSGRFLQPLEEAPAGDVLPIVKGDEFAAGLARLDMVKIDVEGFEPQVIGGLRETLARLRPCVLYENSATTQRGIPTVEALGALFPPEYRFFNVHRQRGRLLVFELPGYRLSPLGTVAAASEEILGVPGERGRLLGPRAAGGIL